MKIAFNEEQKFTQWWLWLILIGIGLVPVFGIYKQLILGEPFGDNAMSDAGLILFAVLVFALIAFFWTMRLETKIDDNGIRMQFFPFLRKRLDWEEIKTAKIVNYGFVGFGIRLGTKHGTVYNTKGNKGLAIQLTNGKKFVIGTQKETELNEIVKKASERHQL